MLSGPNTDLRVIALHGFLGLASDWDLVGLDELESIDLWTDVGDDLAHWAHRFNTEIREMNLRPILLGYSMGGRLAMEAVLQAPELYRGAVFVSTNPGLPNATKADRDARWKSDQHWAERIRKEPWETWLQDWNAQSVLQTPPTATIQLKRNEKDFDRERLASALLSWSLARQADQREKLRRLEVPVLFVSGAEDTKFTALLQSLTLAPAQSLKVVAGAGHRVPWDQPQAFARVVREFLAGLSEVC